MFIVEIRLCPLCAVSKSAFALLSTLFAMRCRRIVCFLSAFSYHLQMSSSCTQHLLGLCRQTRCELLVDLCSFYEFRVLWVFGSEMFLCDAVVVATSCSFGGGR